MCKFWNKIQWYEKKKMEKIKLTCFTSSEI